MEHVSNGFAALGVSEKLVAALERRNITTPSPIQTQAIPPAIEGKDVVGIAQTGTGKTFAFGLPALMRISRSKGLALILLPTRELALQVDEELRKVAGGFGLRSAVIIGGASMGRQKQELFRKPHVIIATPGRLIDHMEQRSLSLNQVNTLILDEADRMLDMGFWPQIRRIIEAVPTDRQTMLFSATMPREVMELASKHMHTPVRIEIAPQGTTAERVEQEVVIVDRRAKNQELEEILTAQTGSVLVFTRMKFGAKRLAAALRRMGFTADELHGDRSLAQRKKALADFKTGKVRVLVATDIAARGIDVKGIALVVNYDLPDQTEDYVHRIGRTGRAGKAGRAVSFVQPDEMGDLRMIERLIRTQLPSRRSGKKPEAPSAAHSDQGTRRDRTGDRPHRYTSVRQRDAREERRASEGSSSSDDRRTHRGGSSRGNTQSRGPKRFNERSRRSTDPVEGHPERYQPPAGFKRGKRRA